MQVADVYMNNEGQYIDINDLSFKKVVNRFQLLTKLSFEELAYLFSGSHIRVDDYASQVECLMMAVLGDPDYRKYQSVLYEILKYEGFNMRYELILYMRYLADIHKREITDKKIMDIKNSLQVKDLVYEQGKLIFDTRDYGEIVVEPILNYLNGQDEACNYVRREIMLGHCNSISWDLLEYLDYARVVCSLLPTCFKGSYYHTYLKLDGQVIDAAGYMALSEEKFNCLFEPSEIYDLDKRSAHLEYSKIKDKRLSYYPEALAIAYSRQMRG